MSDERGKITGYVIEVPDRYKHGDYIFLEPRSLQIYYWPERAIKAGPTAAELAECTSRNQREALLNPWFNIGQMVQFEVLDERRGIATRVRKFGNIIHEYACHLGVPGYSFKTTCILSEGEVKQCYSAHLKYVTVDQDYVRGAMPFVPFNAYVRIDVDKINLQCTFRLNCFDVEAPVAAAAREGATNVPWYTERTLHPMPVYLGGEEEQYDEEPDEVQLWTAAMQKEFEPKEILCGKGFFVKSDEIYCNVAPMWRVRVPWTPPEYRSVLWEGRVVKFEAYYCKVNKCYVVFKWRETHLPIDTGIAGQNASIATFKAGLLRKCSPVGVYWNAHVGFVRDETRVLEAFRTAPDQPIWAYLKYSHSSDLFKFVVDRIATEQYPDGTPAQQTEYRGVMVVTGFDGRLYTPKFYSRMCLLPEHLRASFRPGQYVHVEATCSAESGVFEVRTAKAVQRTPFPVNVDEDRTAAVLKVQVDFVKEHPLYFIHDMFGPIKCSRAKFISAARFKNVRPVIKIMDGFGTEGADGCRFKFIGVENTGLEESNA